MRHLAMFASPLLLLFACSTDETPGRTRDPSEQLDAGGADVTEREIPPGYRKAIEALVAEIDGRTGLGPDLQRDTEKLTSDALEQLRTGGDSLDEGFWLAVHATMRAYPVGHLQVYPKNIRECGTESLPWQSTSRIGACAQPYEDHAVITSVQNVNPLGLVPGDRIVAIDDLEGPSMLDRVLATPMCGAALASPAHSRAVAATSLFARASVGTRVRVQHLDGSVEEKTLDTMVGAVSCTDPWARVENYAARATLRSDGAAVLRIPSFFPANFDPNDIQKSVAELRDEILAEFDRVKDAPELVIDVRGNTGGASLIALEIAAGMPGAQASTLIARCASRVPHTPRYESHFEYEMPASSSFAYAGKVAVLADGLTFSAADYFVRALRLATETRFVGRRHAGAYGGSDVVEEITEGPGLSLYPDPWRCTDADGEPLEGTTMTPDLEVDLDPADIAAGIDSDVEAAVGLLRSAPSAEPPLD